MKSRFKRLALAIALLATTSAVSAAAPSNQIVVCAPGSPGSTSEAQPTMDAFAAALSASSKTPLTAVYDPADEGGVKRLQDAGIGIVSLPFFLAHADQLQLHARLVAVQQGRPALDTWSLVAQKGKYKSAADLRGVKVVSNAAFAPGFVKGNVLGGVDVQPQQASAVLSPLRKAASGEAIAVICDGPQTAALATLPFKDQLEVIAHSPAMPAGLVVTIDARAPAWPPIEKALLALDSKALDSVHMARFEKLDDAVLAAARKAYAR